MNAHPKIKDMAEILPINEQLKANNQKVVLCHGHFNVIHPGHVRFLEYAKTLGDILIVSVVHDSEFPEAIRDEYFPQEERVKGLASREMIDYICPIPGAVEDLIHSIKPDLYVKGREFENKQDVIMTQIKAVESYGGKVIFGSGDLTYSSKSLRLAKQKWSDPIKTVVNVVEKYDINLDKIINQIEHFSNINLMVVGDTIVDQFVRCDILGVSSEAPVIATREIESADYLGGAGIVAKHARSLGANVNYISVVGEDHVANFVEQDLKDAKVQSTLVRDQERPTTFKTRYMVDDQKLFRVSRLKQHNINQNIEKKIIENIRAHAKSLDGLIISDFVYGVITTNIFSEISQLARKNNFLIFADLQCSSQMGDVSKFKGVHLITPTEKEARIAMGDQSSGLEKLALDLLQKTGCKHLAITLGAQGVLNYTSDNNQNFTSEFLPALENYAVDVAGAGDTMLTGYALGLCSGLTLLESSILGTCLAAISVTRIGNIPISVQEVTQYLKKINNYSKVNRGLL